MAATQTHTDVANRLRPALLKLARELRRETHALGVTGGQVTLLIQIRRNRGIGVNGLAALERISAAAMSKHVARLERAGLVRRTQHEATDAGTGLSVTHEGERVLRSVKSRRTAWLAARLRAARADELDALDARDRAARRLLEDDVTVAFRRTFASLRKHRNYRLFFTGQVVSLVGTWMQNIALAWYVVELHTLGRRRRLPRLLPLRAVHRLRPRLGRRRRPLRQPAARDGDADSLDGRRRWR